MQDTSIEFSLNLLPGLWRCFGVDHFAVAAGR
jgi:hypothetical protein